MPITYEHRVPAATLGGLALAAGQEQYEAQRGREDRARAMQLAQMAQQQQMQNQRMAYDAASTQYRTMADYNKFVANAQIDNARDVRAHQNRLDVLNQQDNLAQGRMQAQWDHAAEIGQQEDVVSGLKTRLTDLRGMVNEDGRRMVDGFRDDYNTIISDPRLSPGQISQAVGALSLKVTDSDLETEYAKEPVQEMGVPFVIPGTGQRVVNLPNGTFSAGRDYRGLPEIQSIMKPDGSFDVDVADELWVRRWGSLKDGFDSQGRAIKIARWRDWEGKQHQEEWVAPEERARVLEQQKQKEDLERRKVQASEIGETTTIFKELLAIRPLDAMGEPIKLTYEDEVDLWSRALGKGHGGKEAADAYLEENGYMRTGGRVVPFNVEEDMGRVTDLEAFRGGGARSPATPPTIQEQDARGREVVQQLGGGAGAQPEAGGMGAANEAPNQVEGDFVGVGFGGGSSGGGGEVDEAGEVDRSSIAILRDTLDPSTRESFDAGMAFYEKVKAGGPEAVTPEELDQVEFVTQLMLDYSEATTGVTPTEQEMKVEYALSLIKGGVDITKGYANIPDWAKKAAAERHRKDKEGN